MQRTLPVNFAVAAINNYMPIMAAIYAAENRGITSWISFIAFAMTAIRLLVARWSKSIP